MKYSLKFFQDLATSRHGKCLSHVYTNIKSKAEWQCEKKHKWTTSFASVLYQKSWCPKCRNENSSTRQLGSIDSLHLLAKKKGGKCLATAYLGVRYKVEWQCNKIHKWNARPSDIKQGSWCPVCARNLVAKEKIRYSLKDIQHLAETKRGQCLSKEYNNTCDKIILKCENNHTWTSTAKRLIAGNWCRACHYQTRKVTIEIINDRLKLNNIRCLNIERKNKVTKLRLVCPNGHEWTSQLSAARRQGGCPVCSKRQRYTIENMNELASKHGGMCLSKKYTNNFTHLQWKCVNNHVWSSTPRVIINGSWCPTCSCLYSVNEEKCRFLFETIFKTNFPKDNKAIKPLELDGYNKNLKLAFEYNGELHYKFIPGLHKDRKKFINQKKRDKQKKLLCKQKNIKLVVIHYKKARSDEILISHICNKIKILFPNVTLPEVKLDNFVYIPNKLNELKKIAHVRGGQCLSGVYINNKKHLAWKCRIGHKWTTSASTIKRGCWCPVCAIIKKHKSQNRA